MYQALYRQYRPQTFDEVLGQDHITTILKNQIKKGNIGHAYLFSGTKGTGKTSTAKIFSRAVNCLNLQDGNPCNRCDICRGILGESIMDVIEMDAASNRKIEDIRELRDKVVYPPSSAKYKIYIVDEVHMLTREAFNALLKTLEEPPAHLIFILATTEAHKLPQTILSRCQRFDFKRITSKDIISNMKDICDKLGVYAEERALALIARNSDGAMRDALSLLDQCISYREELTYEDTLDILGIASTDLLFSMVEDIKSSNIEKSLVKVDKIIQEGKDINQFIRDLIYHFRNLLIGKTSESSTGIIDMDEKMIESYIEQGKDMPLDLILRALDILNETERKARWATQPRVILEMAIIRMVNLKEKGSIENRIEKLERALSGGQIDIKGTSKPKEESITTIDKDTIRPQKISKKRDKIRKPVETFDNGKELNLNIIRQEWSRVLNIIRGENIRIKALLREGKLISFVNNTLCIGYEDGYGIHKEAISRPDNKEIVEKIVSSYFKRDISLKFIMDDGVSIGNEEDNMDDIQEVVDFFGEDIVKIEE
ncbi:MAG TPA: DNA polymerase III subunit gamma/tau [Tepidimicrobium sp.]|nr:DNA polymerase III subunit gamma/tau [Tepidimicrobium sp.]